MTHSEQWKGYAELYVLGALDGQDLLDFKAHLAGGCSACAIALRETHGLLGALSHALPAVEPSVELKERVMAQIAPEAAPLAAGWSFKNSVLAWSFIGALAFAAAFVVAVFQFPSQQPSLVKKHSGHTAEMAALLSEESTKMLMIQDAKDSTGYGKLVWNFNRCGGCLFLTKLAKIPEGKAFQLWGIDTQNKPVSIGIFTADDQGNAHVDFTAMQNPQSFNGFKITVEDQGGALAPTSVPLLQTRPI